MRHHALRWLVSTLFGAATLWGWLADPSLRAEETEIATIEHPDPVDFQRELLPILRKKCLACHNGTDAESDLVLETPATILQGGFEGPAVVAGDPDESLMLVLAANRREPVMPPEDNDSGATLMTPEELALLKLWIEQGAKGEVTTESEQIQWKPLPPGVNPVYAAAQSLDGRFLVAGRANQAWVYDLLLNRYVDDLVDPDLANSTDAHGKSLAHLDLVQSLAFSHDGQWIASGGYRTVKLWSRLPAVKEAAQLSLADPATGAHFTAKSDYISDAAGQIHVVSGESLNGDEDTPFITLDAQAGRIVSFAVSPSAAHVAVINEDKTLRIWDAEHTVIDARPQTAAIHQLAWIDDTTLAAACDDHLVRVWSVDTSGKLGTPREFVGHTQPVTSVTACGVDRLISGSQDGNVRVWVVESGTLQREVNHEAAVQSLAATVDPPRIVSAGGDVPAKVWNLDSGEKVADLSVNPTLQWQRDQLLLAQQVAKRHVDNLNKDLEEANKRVTAEEESLKKTQEARDKAEEELKKSKEAAKTASDERAAAEQKVATAKEQLAIAEKAAADAADDEAKKSTAESLEKAKKVVADAEAELKPKAEADDKAKKTLADGEKSVDSSKRSVMTSEKALADAQESVKQLVPQRDAATENQKVAEQATKAAEEALQSGKIVAQLVALSTDGGLIALADAEHHVLLCRSSDGRPVQLVTVGDSTPVGLAFDSPLSLHAVTADGRILRIDAQMHWQLTQTLGAPDNTSPLADRVTALSFSPDDQWLAVGGGEPSRGGELKIYRVEDASLVREIADAHSDTVFGLAFSPDGKQLASCGADRFMKVFDVESGDLLRTYEGHTHHVLTVAWRADGRVLATGGADKVVKLWNVNDGSQIRTIQGFGKEVTSVQFAGAEDHLFAACGDQNLYRCDMAGERKSISTGKDFLYVVSTNLLGKSVAFGGHDSVVRVVDDSGAQLAELKPSSPSDP